MSNRLDQERQKRLEHKRIKYAIKKIKALGYMIVHEDEREIAFMYQNERISWNNSA